MDLPRIMIVTGKPQFGVKIGLASSKHLEGIDAADDADADADAVVQMMLVIRLMLLNCLLHD